MTDTTTPVDLETAAEADSPLRSRPLCLLVLAAIIALAVFFLGGYEAAGPAASPPDVSAAVPETEIGRALSDLGDGAPLEQR